jgi:hypothetical protein
MRSRSKTLPRRSRGSGAMLSGCCAKRTASSAPRLATANPERLSRPSGARKGGSSRAARSAPDPSLFLLHQNPHTGRVGFSADLRDVGARWALRRDGPLYRTRARVSKPRSGVRVQSRRPCRYSRRFWLPLQQQCADYEERVFPFLGEHVLVVSGTRGLLCLIPRTSTMICAGTIKKRSARSHRSGRARWR